MALKKSVEHYFLICLIIVTCFLFVGCSSVRKSIPNPFSKKKKTVEQTDKKTVEKEVKKEVKKTPVKKKTKAKKAKPKPAKKEIVINKTTKAYLIANYGNPKKVYWSKDAEEILIYNRISDIGRNVMIFLNNKGIVKKIVTQSKK
jgi:hypothetical protein